MHKEQKENMRTSEQEFSYYLIKDSTFKAN